MKDLISRAAAIEAIKRAIWDKYTAKDAIDAVCNVPSAQPEIIRCKDCKYHEDEESGMVYCPNQVGGWVSEDFFCKDGEREEE